MKIAILGNTPAAHQIAQKLLSYPTVEMVYHLGAPADVAQTDRYIKLLSDKGLSDSADSIAAIIPAIKELDVDLILPITHPYQLWPAFQDAVKDTPTLMPSKEIGLLEWSKLAGKQLLKELGIPTADYQELTLEEIKQNFFKFKRPFVLKFDQDWRAGLQTIVVTDDNIDDEYNSLISKQTTKRFLSYFGNFVNQKFVVEEYIEGTSELSYHALSNSISWTYLGSARDYKKRYENDCGHNTSGMGAYRIKNDIDSRIHEYADRIFKYYRDQGTPYIGVLYLGIMIDKHGDPIVLEINTRFGDPEITAILPGIKNNIVDLFYSAATNKELYPLTFNDNSVVSIRVVHKDYSLNNHTNVVSPKLDIPLNNILIGFNESKELLHSVLTATGKSNKEAADKLYNILNTVDMGDFVFRKDIGYLI